MAAGIDHMQKALLDSFWVDPIEMMPSELPVWCEVWLRLDPDDSDSLLADFFAVWRLEIGYKNQQISFPERLVTLIHASQRQLKN